MSATSLTLGAALVLGLAASGHCLVMCGGISAALGVATSKGTNGRPRPLLLVGYQAGRTLSYALAGIILGGALGGVVDLVATDSVRSGLRVVSALALVLAALVAFGGLRDPAGRIGSVLWRRIAPLGRRLLPVATLPRAVGFGMVWGFMPCGFVYTVLVIATLQLDAWRSAATMLAFGLGTAPAMLATAFGAQRYAGFTGHPAARRVAGSVLVASAALTLAGPWLAADSAWMHAWLPFLCTTPVH
ncbi:MAG: sulfite exporter TauE/SafE family protein [Proteobacteria bacterium]|nr:sulfite exporter TauE/SafE family protein [Pseudomonadota bacterium]